MCQVPDPRHTPCFVTVNSHYQFLSLSALVSSSLLAIIGGKISKKRENKQEKCQKSDIDGVFFAIEMGR